MERDSEVEQEMEIVCCHLLFELTENNADDEIGLFHNWDSGAGRSVLRL